MNVNTVYKSAYFKHINNKLNSDLNKTQQKIASGKKYYNSGGNPADYILAEDLKTDINGYRQLKLNLEDSVNFLNSFEDVLNATTETLNRINVLLLEASNETSSDETKELIRVEVDELINQLDSNADKVIQLNNKKFLSDVENTELIFRFGINQNEVISFKLKNITSDGLNLSSEDITDKNKLKKLLSTVQNNLKELIIYRNEVGQVASSFMHRIKYIDEMELNTTNGFSKLRDSDAAEETINQTKLSLHTDMVNNIFKNVLDMSKLKTDRLLTLLNK
jgi:flagellin